MSDGGLSQHPTDRLIREIIQSRRQATLDEIEQIIERMATVPFDPRVRNVRTREHGTVYGGRTVGAREESLFYHLSKRVVVEKQWADGTTADEYLADLRRGVRSADAHLLVYNDRAGPLAATVTPTVTVVPSERQGLNPLPNVIVVYSADRGNIITGYQFSTLDNVRLPQEALWLK